MYSQPWYSGYDYPSAYSPYSSYRTPYHAPAAFHQGFDYDDVDMQERARALAERRARRAQYLPDEDEDDDVDNWEYNQLGPRQQAYLEAKQRQQIVERRQQEEAAREQARQELLERKLAEQEELVRRQTFARQERQRALEQRHREEEEARQKMVAERKRQLRLKREEEARRMAEEEAKSKQQSRTRSRSRSFRSQQAPSQEGSSIPVHSHRPSSPSLTSTQPPRSHSATPQPRTPTPPPKHTPEELNEAASKIQNRYRIHSSFKILNDAASQFNALKKDFVYPRAIDFQKPGAESGHITVGAYRAPSDFDNEDEEPMQVDGPEGKLDYTSTNYPLHAYSEGLNKLLIKLDGVESWGKKAIRDKRRAIVKSIEKEASKLDRYCKQAWLDYLASKTEALAEAEDIQKPEQQLSEPQPAPSQMDTSESVAASVSEEDQQAEIQPVQEEVSQGPRKIPISSLTESKDASMEGVDA